ncbi:hypothetical protein QL285_086822 [Trifolium repens]|nr:hypothetical protein QL285_086822 [Trifolium repens]
MNELMKSNPSNSISLSIYFFYAFASFYEQPSFSILKTIIIVERHRYRISPCGDDKFILTFVHQQKGSGRMGPSLGQRVMVVASSNATIVRNRVTSRRIVLGEGAVVVRRLRLRSVMKLMRTAMRVREHS